MCCVPASERVFWRWCSTGSIASISTGYEYAVTVAPDQFDALRRGFRTY
jgi:hypothetical protein